MQRFSSEKGLIKTIPVMFRPAPVAWAAPYAMSGDDIACVLAYDNHCDKVIYYHNLLITGCRVLISVLPNAARGFFQTRVFGGPNRIPKYQLHLGLDMSECVMDQ